MRKTIAAALLAVIAPLLLAASPAGIPKALRYRFSPAFAWVPETEAFDSAGHLRDVLFGASVDALKANLAANRDGVCRNFMTQPPGDAKYLDTSIAGIAANARSMISGAVVSSGRGFYNALPGTLVAIDVAKELPPRQRRSAAPRIAYVFIPSAAIVTAHGALCSRSLTGVPVPRVGDRVVAFAFAAPTDEAGAIVPLNSDRHLIIERNGRRLYTPRDLQHDVDGTNVEQIAARVERQAAAARDRK